MNAPRALVLVAAALLVGALEVDYAQQTKEVDPEPVEVPFGRLAAGSVEGVNSTNASATVVGTLLSSTTHALYLNNTNATGAWYVMFRLYDSSGVGNLALLDVGVDNGTSEVDQIRARLGDFTQTAGSFVRLEPASTNTVYVENRVGALSLTSRIHFDVIVSDTASGDNHYVMKASLSVT